MTTREDIRAWFVVGTRQSADFMIVVCDTYDHSNYPVFCSDRDVLDEHEKYSMNMQKVMEVYDLKADMETQLSEVRAFNLPKEVNPNGEK